MTRPLILVSNDDGVGASGIRALADAMMDLGDVVVVAPDREQSATSHSFTLNRPLRVEELRENWFSIDGSPADSVYVGVLKLCGRKPDLLVSGINHGYNLGTDVFYSGTVACAVEAAIREIPAIAMSLEWRRGMAREPEQFETAAKFAHSMARSVLEQGLPKHTLLSVNVPQDPKPRGYKWTKLGRRLYHDQVDERADLRGRRYYWIGGQAAGYDDVPGSDCEAVHQGWIAVTPIDLDLTHEVLLAKLPDWTVAGFQR